MNRLLYQNKFIEKATIFHKGKYDYSLVEYINLYTKVKIICPIHGVFEQTPEKHLSGGCKICGAIKAAEKALIARKENQSKLQEDFVKKAITKHGNRYDYSLVEYINAHNKIKIICPIHGMFEQIAQNHLNSDGCKQCATDKLKYDKEELISKFNLLHNNKYSYNLDNYETVNSKIKIFCPMHGWFTQLVSSHLKNTGCRKCQFDSMRSTDFIEKATAKHGSKFDYSLVKYVSNRKKVKIICPIHGVFEQIPDNHLNYGCKQCSIDELRKTTEQFIVDATLVHDNKYDYSLVEYINNVTKVKIICKKCNKIFKQAPSTHLNNCGCPSCASSKGESRIEKFLIAHNIEYFKEYKFENCVNPDTGYQLRFDFYIPSKNLLVEFDGKQHFKPTRFGGMSEQQQLDYFNKLQILDSTKNEFAEQNNISLLRIPYTKINKIDNILSDRI